MSFLGKHRTREMNLVTLPVTRVLIFCVFHFCGIDERRVGIIGAIQPACPSLTPCVFYVWMLKNSEKIIERFYINLLF